MKKVSVSVLIAALFLGAGLSAGSGDELREIKTQKDKVSYSLGYQIGGDFRRQGLDITPELVVKGIQDAISDTEPAYSKREMREILVDLKKAVVTADRSDREKKAMKNLEAGRAFLADNEKREGVHTLASGLQYRVLRDGSGAVPDLASMVDVHYRGTLIDGSEFDSSYKRKEPATFRVSQSIAGWKEALQLMKEGSKWELYIPPELAYGEGGTGRIGPNSALIFEVELISVKRAE